MKNGKYTHNLTPRDKFLMGKPIPPEPYILRGKNTRHSFPPSIFPSTHPVPPGSKKTYRWLLTVAKPLKPDLGYHFTSVRKIPYDLEVLPIQALPPPYCMLSASHTSSLKVF